MMIAHMILGLINIGIVIAILLLVGAVVLWFCGNFGFPVPANVQKGFIAVVGLVGLYMLVALLLGMPTLQIVSAPG